MFKSYLTFRTLVIGFIMFCVWPEFATFATFTVGGYYLIGRLCDACNIK